MFTKNKNYDFPGLNAIIHKNTSLNKERQTRSLGLLAFNSSHRSLIFLVRSFTQHDTPSVVGCYVMLSNAHAPRGAKGHGLNYHRMNRQIRPLRSKRHISCHCAPNWYGCPLEQRHWSSRGLVRAPYSTRCSAFWVSLKGFGRNYTPRRPSGATGHSIKQTYVDATGSQQHSFCENCQTSSLRNLANERKSPGLHRLARARLLLGRFAPRDITLQTIGINRSPPRWINSIPKCTYRAPPWRDKGGECGERSTCSCWISSVLCSSNKRGYVLNWIPAPLVAANLQSHPNDLGTVVRFFCAA